MPEILVELLKGTVTVLTGVLLGAASGATLAFWFTRLPRRK